MSDSYSKAAVWKAYGTWALWVGLTFFAVYPTCNWWASQRGQPFDLFLQAELNLPFIPMLIWAYASMYLLFLSPPFLLNASHICALGKQLTASTLLSGVIFVLVPARLGYVRTLPDDPFYASLYGGMFAVDLPYNMVPSLHVVFSALIVQAVLRASTSLLAKTAWLGWLVLICLSTLLVHQHHLLDVIAGLTVAWAFHHKMKKKGE